MAKRFASMGSFLAWAWFPLALVVLLLLALPGYLLFGVNQLGFEGEINRWLQSTYNLTYHIPLPGWAAFLLLLLPVAIVLLYFLKLKRKPVSVSSTFLWRKSIEDLHVNSLLQWLRKNVLLLLQLLILVTLIYALMAFQFHGRGGEGKHYILMIDNSASMAATDIAPSRLAWAKDEALREIDAAGDNDVGMVVVFNSRAEILQSYTSNRDLLRQAVRRIEPTQRPTRIDEALQLADSLANPTRSADDAATQPSGVEPGKERTYVAAEGIPAEVHLFSDGRFPDVPDFALGNLDLRLHTAGKSGSEETDNLALVNFNAVRDESDAGRLTVFVRALNFRSRPARGQIELEVWVGGRRVNLLARPVELAAQQIEREPADSDGKEWVRDVPGEASVTFDIEDRPDMELHARLVPEVADPFPLDDEAWLVVGVVRKARVLIVGTGPEILPRFFDAPATRKVADVDYITAAELTDPDKYLNPARNGEYDLVIFDRCAPAQVEDMPRANTFFIGQPPPPWKIDEAQKLENPQIKVWMSRHPILQYLTGLHEILIGEAFKLEGLPPRTPFLIETSGNTPLLFTLERSSFTDLVLAFPIITAKGEWNTKWPLQPQFPLFLRNVLYTLGNVRDTAGEDTVQPGQPKTIRPDAAIEQVRVTDPAGTRQTLERGTRADFYYPDTDRVGVYQVAWDGGQRDFAVNLLDAEESNLAPRSAIQIGAARIAASQETGQPRPLWKWFVLAALLFVLLEWYIYNRRIII